jgi:hypothetical protein
MKNWPLATVVSGVRRFHSWYRKFESVPLRQPVPSVSHFLEEINEIAACPGFVLFEGRRRIGTRGNHGHSLRKGPECLHSSAEPG